MGRKKLVEKMRRRQRVIREDNREKKLVGRYINDTKSSIKTYFYIKYPLKFNGFC